MQRTWRVAALACAVALMCTGTAMAAAGIDNDTVIVQFRPGVTPVQQAAVLQGAPVIGTIYGTTTQVARVANPVAAAARLNRNALVQYAEVNKILRATAVPNDPRFAELYGLNNTGQGGGTPDADIDAPEGWDLAGLGTFPSSGGVKVGVVDTGILATHEDLAGKLANCAQSRGLAGLLSGSIQVGSCADDNGHGTHVSGTITGNANNGKGVTGVAFNSQLAMCRALGGPLGSGSTADVANCINWVTDQGAKVISMSLGGGDSTTLHNAVARAWNNGNGVLVIAAAGNDGDSTVNYPAAYSEVVSVAATDNKDARASFSNANSDVEIAGPGVNVLSSYNGSNSSYTTLGAKRGAPPPGGGAGGSTGGGPPTSPAARARPKGAAGAAAPGPAGRDTSFGFGRVNLAKAAS